MSGILGYLAATFEREFKQGSLSIVKLDPRCGVVLACASGAETPEFKSR